MNLTETMLFLFIVSFCAGVVDAVAGGGGLLTLPALFVIGLSPSEAIATNKIQALACVASAACRFVRSRESDIRSIPIKATASLIGAAVGAMALRLVNPVTLSKLVPIALLMIALFFLISPRFSTRTHRALVGETVFLIVGAFPIGFYDGFFGPGTGSLYVATFVILLGRDLRRANADAKLLNTAGSFIAALIFMFGGMISWSCALVMSLGAIFGAQLGSHLAIKFGASYIRVALVVTTTVMALRIAAEHHFSLF